MRQIIITEIYHLGNWKVKFIAQYISLKVTITPLTIHYFLIIIINLLKQARGWF
jgi:hypothetical protein